MLISTLLPRPAIIPLLICVSFVGGCASERSSAGREPASYESFSFVLEITQEGGVAATCELGCTWVNVDARYPDSRYRISSNGIGPAIQIPAMAPPPEALGFRLFVTVSDSEISADCESGCKWESATASSPIGAYRISTEGIEPLR